MPLMMLFLLPKMAGEWLIEQIKMFKEFNNSKIIIVSASPIIKEIAERYNVLYLPKVYAKNSDSEVYKQFIV